MRPATLLLVAAAVLSVGFTTWRLTAPGRTSPPCPICGAMTGDPVIRHDEGTIYVCPTCKKTFYGPPRSDFSVLKAAESLLSE